MKIILLFINLFVQLLCQSIEPHYINGHHNLKHKHTEEEMDEHKKDFSWIDSDQVFLQDISKDNFLSLAEIKAHFELNKQQVFKVIDAADLDKDDKLNFEEYLHLDFYYIKHHDEL